MSKAPSNSTKQPTFQLKGTMLAITVFEIAHFNIERLTQELSQKIKEAPEFFETIPMVLSIDKLAIPLTKVELKGLISLLKEYRVQLMALRTDNPSAIATANKLGLVVLPPTTAREKLIELATSRAETDVANQITEVDNDNTDNNAIAKSAEGLIDNEAQTDTAQQQLAIDEATDDLVLHEDEKTIASTLEPIDIATTEPSEIETTSEPQAVVITTTQPSAVEPSQIISSPVRSGQQIEALSTSDLIVTANVSTGAELITNGNIHIYGTMRGRAMAGYHGNNKARIFCHKLTAELISIAGQIITEEELRRHPLWGKAAQLSLENNQINITPL